MISIFDKGAFAPCPAPFNLAAHVLRPAVDHPGKIALEVLGQTASQIWSYADLEAAVRGTGTGLLEAGLQPGDIVLMRLGNTVDFPIAYLGAIAAGITPVPTSSQLTPPEIAKMVAELDVAAVLRDPAVASTEHPKEIPLEDLTAMRSLPPCDYQMGDPERLAYVVYTSGTSGKPRAVAHAHRAIWARQMMIRDWYDLSETDRLLHAGAFNWTFTLGTGLMDPWAMGATALIPEPETDPTAIPALLRQYQATIFAAAPGVYRKILSQNGDLSIPSLRHGLCAGEKLSQHLSEQWRQRSETALYEAYGMSECSTFISSSPAHPARGDALGQPQPGRRVAILGPDGPVPQGTEGTIAVHRSDPGLMLGYLNAPEETEARMQGEWFLTGDQGAMAVDGQVTYLGRADDMMNAGGFRVSPIEVETVLATHPDIAQVGVASVEVKADTHIIVAFYTGAHVIATEVLMDFASSRLARYKQPRAYVHLDALPTGANGKLLRRALPAYFEG
ncbi:class I adenylate-forming enzyme family protein [Phaeobacter sp. PT47_59]|uniref:class I adenylate-forming enzyme family protein n=1 Tax=Phaeobacter sp. PT47_59 TaxID=3029979 RepID=UPI0023805B59|nr:class I adenylate-forming enzyme family protein [Phaeobacter sp. PT47_59]MDE4174999.1 class I adenylate-forming enzyme family protein [Phaeobacter sp. PT47_59]